MAISCDNNAWSKSTTPEDQKTPIDVYLLAGQSNMVGYSPIKDLTDAERNTYYNFAHIYAQGEGHHNYYNRWLVNPDIMKEGVKPGAIGLTDDYIGPEAGILAYLSTKYEANPNARKKATIIKYAQGGSALYDRWFSENIKKDETCGHQLQKDAAGNPCPIREYKGKVVGDLYYNMINCFIDQIHFLEKDYKPRVIGLVWAQGCHDAINKHTADHYEQNLTAFVSDVRNDLNTEFPTLDLTSLPIIINEIPTHEIGGAPYNNTVSTAEKNVCKNDENCTLVSTSFATTGTTGPTDPHFKGDDMMKIGKADGEALYKRIEINTNF